MKPETKVMLDADRIPEANKFADFMNELTPAEQREMLAFMQGFKYGIKTQTAAVPA